MKFNKKGQGALEYLLLIGGAVLIAVIVIALLVGMGSSGRQGAQDNATTTTQIVSGTAIAPVLNSAVCTSATALALSFTNQTGQTLLLVDDGVVTTVVPTNGSNTVTAAVCSTTGSDIQIRATTGTGSIADSNPIRVSFNP